MVEVLSASKSLLPLIVVFVVTVADKGVSVVLFRVAVMHSIKPGTYEEF